jgi:hypothetical protein
VKRCPNPRFHTIDGNCAAPVDRLCGGAAAQWQVDDRQSTVLRSGSGSRQRTCFAPRCRPKIDRRERNRRESGDARDARLCCTSRYRRKNRGILLCRHKQRRATRAQQRSTLSSCVGDLTYPRRAYRDQTATSLKKSDSTRTRSSLSERWQALQKSISAARVLAESERQIGLLS